MEELFRKFLVRWTLGIVGRTTSKAGRNTRLLCRKRGELTSNSTKMLNFYKSWKMIYCLKHWTEYICSVQMGIRLDGTNNTKVITAARGTHSSHTTSPTTTAVKGRLGITGRRKNGVPGRQSYDSGSRLGRSTSFSAVFTAALVSEMGQHYAKHQMQSGVRVYHQRHYRQAIARWRSALHRLK